MITNENLTYSCLYIYICGISGSVYTTLYIMSSNEKSHSCLYICEIKRNVYTILFSLSPYTLVHTIKYGIAYETLNFSLILLRYILKFYQSQ